LNSDHYAKEAARLLADDVLNHALDKVKADALDALATADVDDKTMMLRLQQRVEAINDIRSELRNAVNRVKAATSQGTVA
jgi:hypothetical protein